MGSSKVAPPVLSKNRLPSIKYMSTVYLYKKNTVDGLTVHQSQQNLGRPDNRRTRRRRLKMRPWVSWVSTMLESNFPPSHYYSARRVRLGVTGSCGAPSTKAISCLVMEQFSSDAITTWRFRLHKQRIAAASWRGEGLALARYLAPPFHKYNFKIGHTK